MVVDRLACSQRKAAQQYMKANKGLLAMGERILEVRHNDLPLGEVTAGREIRQFSSGAQSTEINN